MSSRLKEIAANLNLGFEEAVLIAIIILNVMDFFQLLNPDFEYINNILSWAALGYLIYAVSLSDIFFGAKDKKLDAMLIIAYFILSLKNIIGYAMGTLESMAAKGISYWGILTPANDAIPGIAMDAVSLYTGLGSSIQLDNLAYGINVAAGNSIYANLTMGTTWEIMKIEPRFMVHGWLTLLIDNAGLITKASLYAGFLALLLIALYSAQTRIADESLLGRLNCSKLPYLLRAASIFLVFVSFFVIVFNLAIEWLAIAVDAHLLVFFLIVLMLMKIRHKDYTSKSMIFRLGNLGNEFYDDFLRLFRSRRGIFLAISAMLVLHLLTDIGNYLIPYLFGFHDALYFDQLGAGHDAIFSMTDLFSRIPQSIFFSQLQDLSFLGVIALFYVYMQNFIAMAMLLAVPAGLWYVMFRQQDLKLPKFFPALFFSALACLMLAPAFAMHELSSSAIAGVDIMTRPVTENPFPIMLLSAAIGMIIFGLSLTRHHSKLVIAAILSSLIFFGYYIYTFFIDIASYYIAAIGVYINHSQYILSSIFGLMFVIISCFYIGGFFIFTYLVSES